MILSSCDLELQETTDIMKVPKERTNHGMEIWT